MRSEGEVRTPPPKAVRDAGFLQTVYLTPDDVWNEDGQGAERVAALLHAVRHLPGSATPDEAQALYWQIENVAVIQGSLLPAGPKILPKLLHGLPRATPASRPFLLDAIHEVASGEPSHQLSIHERERIRVNMVRIVADAKASLIDLLLRGNDDEAYTAADLIALLFTAPHDLPAPTSMEPQEVHQLLAALVTQPHRQAHLARTVGLPAPG